MTQYCYRCGKELNKNEKTFEHAPPRNLFNTDDENFNYRLIKVPSCDDHNTKKSSLDKRIIGAIKSSVRREKTNDKTQKTLENDLNKYIINNNKIILPEDEILRDYFENMAAAIYYYQYQNLITDPQNKCDIFLIAQVGRDLDIESPYDQLSNQFRQNRNLLSDNKARAIWIEAWQQIGPEFQYGFQFPNSGLYVTVGMKFFNTVEVYVVFSEEKTQEPTIINRLPIDHFPLPKLAKLYFLFITTLKTIKF